MFSLRLQDEAVTRNAADLDSSPAYRLLISQEKHCPAAAGRSVQDRDLGSGRFLQCLLNFLCGKADNRERIRRNHDLHLRFPVPDKRNCFLSADFLHARRRIVVDRRQRICG